MQEVVEETRVFAGGSFVWSDSLEGGTFTAVVVPTVHRRGYFDRPLLQEVALRPLLHFPLHMAKMSESASVDAVNQLRSVLDWIKIQPKRHACDWLESAVPVER